MISNSIKVLLLEKKASFMLPAENVATVQVNNPLAHAMLVLTGVKYSNIPVVDKDDKYLGVVGLPNIMGKIIDLPMEVTTLSELNHFTVQDVVDTSAQTILENAEIEEILHKLVDTSFLPVVDEDGYFKGIVTRKEMLKAVNHMVHEFDERALQENHQ